MFSMFCPKVNVRSKVGTMFSDLALDDKAVITTMVSLFLDVLIKGARRVLVRSFM